MASSESTAATAAENPTREYKEAHDKEMAFFRAEDVIMETLQKLKVYKEPYEFTATLLKPYLTYGTDMEYVNKKIPHRNRDAIGWLAALVVLGGLENFLRHALVVATLTQEDVDSAAIRADATAKDSEYFASVAAMERRVASEAAAGAAAAGAAAAGAAEGVATPLPKEGRPGKRGFPVSDNDDRVFRWPSTPEAALGGKYPAQYMGLEVSSPYSPKTAENDEAAWLSYGIRVEMERGRGMLGRLLDECNRQGHDVTNLGIGLSTLSGCARDSGCTALLEENLRQSGLYNWPAIRRLVKYDQEYLEKIGFAYDGVDASHQTD